MICKSLGIRLRRRKTEDRSAGDGYANRPLKEEYLECILVVYVLADRKLLG